MSRSAFILILFVILMGGAVAFYLAVTSAPAEVAYTVPQEQEERTSQQVQARQRLHVEVIVFRDAEGGATADGSRVLEGSTYKVGIKAKKLPRLAEGKSYALWLTRKNPQAGENSFFGGAFTLTREGDYVLGFISQENLAVYEGAIIVVEGGIGQKPEKVVMAGEFRR